MQPSSQSSPQRWNLLTPKINGKFDFRSACRKIPKTTAFILILTLILGISYMIPIFFSLAWNLIPQSGIYLYKVEFTFSTHHYLWQLFGQTLCLTRDSQLLVGGDHCYFYLGIRSRNDFLFSAVAIGFFVQGNA